MQVRELFGGGKYDEALALAEERLRLSEGVYGREHAMTATCINDVATFEQVLARYERAEALFEQASRMQRKLLGDTHPHSIATLQNLAALYTARGDAPKAEAMRLLVDALSQAAAPPA